MSDDLQKKINSSTDDELGRMLVTSGKQLHFGDSMRRHMHRAIIELILTELGQRGAD